MRPALLILLAVATLTLFAPVRYDPMQTDVAAQLQAPSTTHWLGTDLLGRDVFSRTVQGGRQTLLTAIVATLVAALVGLPLGMVASLRARALADSAQATINTLLALPGLLIALVVLTLLGRGIGPMIVALGLAQIAPVAFSTSVAIKTLRVAGYVEASKTLGAGEVHVLVEHIWPNIQPTVFAYLAVIFSYVLLNAAALGFLGLGAELGTPEWGAMLAEGRAAFRAAPWISIGPGAMLSLTIWAVNDLADWLSRSPGERPRLW